MLLFFSQAEEDGMLSVDDCDVVPTVVDVLAGKFMLLLDDVCKVGLNWDGVVDEVGKSPVDVVCGIIEGGFVIDKDGAFNEALHKTLVSIINKGNWCSKKKKNFTHMKLKEKLTEQ